LSLTIKEEIFVQRRIEGYSQTEAYRFAYDCENMKDKTVTEKASKLMAKDNIRARYEELLEEHKQKALYTREKAVNDLIWIKEKAREDIEYKGLKQANGGHFLKSVNELCQLEGLYPTKEENKKDNEEDIAKVLKEALEGI
jgi:predicted transcriptional regulator